MPGFNETGPEGRGPRTGRGLGGMRRRYFDLAWPQNKDGKIESLREYKKALKEELEDVEKEEKGL